MNQPSSGAGTGDGAGFFPTFNVLLAFDDAQSEARAEALLKRMAESLEPPEGKWLRWNKWNFIEASERLASASTLALSADAIVISAHETGELPEVLITWIDGWLPQKVNASCVLVALLELKGDASQGSELIYRHLHGVTKDTNLAFFAKLTEPPTGRVRTWMPYALEGEGSSTSSTSRLAGAANGKGYSR